MATRRTREAESYPDLVAHGPILVPGMTELTRRGTPVRTVSDVDYRLREAVVADDPVPVVGDPADAAEFAARSGPDAVPAQATVRFG